MNTNFPPLNRKKNGFLKNVFSSLNRINIVLQTQNIVRKIKIIFPWCPFRQLYFLESIFVKQLDTRIKANLSFAFGIFHRLIGKNTFLNTFGWHKRAFANFQFTDKKRNNIVSSIPENHAYLWPQAHTSIDRRVMIKTISNY